MLNFKIIGCGAAGNKAAIELLKSGYDDEQIILINSTAKDIDPKYKDKLIIFGKGLGGCGKERSLGKQMIMDDLKNGKIVPEGMTSSRDRGVILVGSTEGGSGSSIIPILAKYFKEVVGVNVICVLFFGFQDDTRGLQNSIELAQELSNEYTIVGISNAKFLKSCNNNRFRAELKANEHFVKLVNILSGATIKQGSQVIDDADLFKIVFTPGYLMADSIPISNITTIEDFNNVVLDFIKDSKYIDPPEEPGVKREGLIFNVEEEIDAIDYGGLIFNDIFGNPYEKFTHLSTDAKGYSLDYILSGMKLPIEELTNLYNKYIENSKKVDKKKDNFFEMLSDMRGNSEDLQFNMLNSTDGKKPSSSKSDFFKNVLGEDNTKTNSKKNTEDFY